MNTIIIDPPDNHFILSFRNISAVVKINRKTGDIIWVLGGGEKDDFSLSNEQCFFGKHAITKEGNTLLLFDNHNWSKTDEDNKVRIKRYELDEKNKKIVAYREIILPFSAIGMGSVERTKQNTYLIGTGTYSASIAFEMDVNGYILWRLNLKDKRLPNYYVHKY